jgi:hypothetical protein
MSEAENCVDCYTNHENGKSEEDEVRYVGICHKMRKGLTNNGHSKSEANVVRYVELCQKMRRAMKYARTPLKVIDLDTLGGRAMNKAYLDLCQIEHVQYSIFFKPRFENLLPAERHFHNNYYKLHCPKHPLPSFED